MENAETHSAKDESVGGETIFENCLQIQGHYEIARTNFEGLYSPSIFQALFFFTEELLAKITEKINSYSSQIYPNKPINCTVYGTQNFHEIYIIGSLTPLSNVCDLWIDVLGRELVKELSQKMFEKIHICLHFNIKNSPIRTALIMTSFTK